NEWIETGSLGRKSTYGWDESSESTFHQRDKEEAHDYRYFPDPDLMPVEVNDAWLDELKQRVSELPAARRKRYAEGFGLTASEASLLASDRQLGDFFEQSLANRASPKRVATLLLSHGLRIANTKGKPVYELGLAAKTFETLALAIDANQVSASSAGPILDHVAEHGTTIEAAIEALGLRMSSDTGAVDAAIDAAIAANPKAVADFQSGKQAALGSIVGAVMK